MQELILFFSSFGTSIISAVVGMAGGVTLLSIMTFFMPLPTIVPIHGAVQLASNSSRCFALRKFIIWPVFRAYLIGLPLGTFLAAYFVKSFTYEKLSMGLVVVLIWYVLFKPKKMPSVRLPYWGFGVLALFVGTFNLFIGATGPLQASFFIRDDWSKEQIVATKAVSQALGHLLKIPAFLYLSFDYFSYLSMIALMVIGVLLGTYIGVKILKNINDKAFRYTYKGVLFLASLRLIYKIVI